MPTYDYRCGKCEHTFEHFQSMKDAPLKVCPSCRAKALERLIGTGAAVLFKGSGFYQTDYRSESYTKAAKAEQSSAASGTAPGAAPAAATAPAATAAAPTAAPATNTPSAPAPPSAKPGKPVDTPKSAARRRSKR
jgi:putative FmdB family regulatory protein